MIKNTIMQSFKPNILCNCRNLSLPQGTRRVGTHVTGLPSEALIPSRSLPKLGRGAGFIWIQPQTCMRRQQAPLLFSHSIHMSRGAKGTTEALLLICHSLVAERIRAIQRKLFSTLEKRKGCLLEGGQLAEKNTRRSWVSVCGPQESPWDSLPQDIKKSVQKSWLPKGHGGIDGTHLFNLSCHFYNSSWRNTGNQLNQRAWKEHPWAKWLEMLLGCYYSKWNCLLKDNYFS